MTQASLASFLQQKIEARKQQDLYRQRKVVTHNTDGIIARDESHFLDFASNDYLGLRNNPEILQAWVNGLAQYGGGSSASPLVTGYYEAHQALESAIAASLNREAALVFSTGFSANQALCRALFADGGIIVADKYMHASFIDGALSSKAQFKRFKHNDVSSLKKVLQQVSDSSFDTPRLLATEGVFSMDGDTPPVDELVQLANEYNFSLMLDEAHALGVLGESGMGTVQAHNLSQLQVPIVMGTFGKALGTSGAFIAGSQDLIDYLVNFARDYIYSTAFPPAQAIATLASLEIVQQGKLTKQLNDNIRYFRQKAANNGITLMDSNSAIQLIPMGNPSKAISLGKALEARGVWTGVMRSPTVPVGTDRIRITLRANHTQRDLDALVDALCLSLG